AWDRAHHPPAIGDEAPAAGGGTAPRSRPAFVRVAERDARARHGRARRDQPGARCTPTTLRRPDPGTRGGPQPAAARAADPAGGGGVRRPAVRGARSRIVVAGGRRT